MERTVVRARVDRRLTQEAEAVLAVLGLTVSDAVRLMILRIAQDKALPFEPPTLPNPKPICASRLRDGLDQIRCGGPRYASAHGGAARS
jgi:DNA-damage-inducible protein J